jgi:hypothetical protein
MHQIKIQDRREKSGEVRFKLKIKNAAIGTPVGPLRVTLVLGASSAASNAGNCGVAAFAADQCLVDGSHMACE